MSILQVPFTGLARQYNNLKDELASATHDALKEGILVSGPQTEMFEAWLRDRCCAEFALVTHSGTQALEIIARAELNVEKEYHYPVSDTIRIPNLTYPATLNAFLTAGWNVELVDVDKNGLIAEFPHNIHTCYVGLYGAAGSRSLAKFEQVADTHIIVDGAQHWLADPSNIGIAMAISFDPTKNLNASGNGGAIITNDIEIYKFSKDYVSNGGKRHECAGTNSKMSEIDCSHLLVRSKYIDGWQIRRKKIRQYYLNAFKDLPLRCLSRDFMFHMDQKFVIETDRRNELAAYLNTNGIETKVHYPYALSELPIAKNLVKPDFISTGVMLTRGVLSLPIYPELTDNEIEYIANTVITFYSM